jgi:uncharacterized protein
MFGRFMPQEGRFFEYFNAHAEHVANAARELVALMSGTEETAAHVAAIDVLETSADKITHDTVALLHKTFITPFDREAIHALINSMDDIIDCIQDVAELISLYNIRRLTPDTQQLAQLSLSCCERVKTTVKLLGDMKNADDMLATCREIDQLESDCDRVMRSAISRLFRDERDALQVMKMKSVYEGLEKISDNCEAVSKVIEGLVLESA